MEPKIFILFFWPRPSVALEVRKYIFKGIVSRDWGELQMIPVDILEVLSIARSYLY